jgi:hypothetical protein
VKAAEPEHMPGSFAHHTRELSPAEQLELRLEAVRRAVLEAEEEAWRSTERPLLSSAELAHRVARQRDCCRSRAVLRRAFSTETRALFLGDHRTRERHLAETTPAPGPASLLAALGGHR